MKRKLLLSMAAIVGVYVLTYTSLSLAGSYRTETLPGGKEIAVWEPLGCCWGGKASNGKEIHGLSTLGHVFLPLVILDRHLFHKTEHLFPVS